MIAKTSLRVLMALAMATWVWSGCSPRAPIGSPSSETANPAGSANSPKPAEPTGTSERTVSELKDEACSPASNVYTEGVLNQDAVLKAQLAADGRVRKCPGQPEHSGEWRIVVVYGPAGCVASVRLVGPPLAEPFRSCALREYLSTSVPPFSGGGMTLSRRRSFP
jgi:hypothetical protein